MKLVTSLFKFPLVILISFSLSMTLRADVVLQYDFSSVTGNGDVETGHPSKVDGQSLASASDLVMESSGPHKFVLNAGDTSAEPFTSASDPPIAYFFQHRKGTVSFTVVPVRTLTLNRLTFKVAKTIEARPASWEVTSNMEPDTILADGPIETVVPELGEYELINVELASLPGFQQIPAGKEITFTITLIPKKQNANIRIDKIELEAVPAPAG